MKKIIIIIAVILVISIGVGIIYLNNVFLPKTIKALLIKSIEEKTNTKVTLGSLKVNIFKGLVLRELKIYDKETLLASIKEASCIILPLPIFQKKFIIPTINLQSPQLLVVRRKDGTCNLQSLFTPLNPAIPITQAPLKQQSSDSLKKAFSVIVSGINISNAKIIFQDDNFEKPFIKSLDNINANVYLSLPLSVRFKFSGLIQESPVLTLSSSGEFKIQTQELNAKISVLNIPPARFAAYYADTGLSITGGLIDVTLNLKAKDGIFYADVEGRGKDISMLRDKISLKSGVGFKSALVYTLKDKNLKYSGSATITGATVSGLEFVDKASNINSDIKFDNSFLSTENLTADILGLPVKAKASLSDFSDPELKMNVTSGLGLDYLQQILKEKFKFILPAALDGQGKIALNVTGKISQINNLALNGSLEVVNSSLKLEKIDSPIKEINGKIEFTKDKLPQPFLLTVKLKSPALTLNSELTFNDKLIKISKCSGRYLPIEFSVKGVIDTADSSKPRVDLYGALLVELKDLNKLLVKSKAQLDKINPIGRVKAAFDLSGDIKEIKNCSLVSKLSSGFISAYGLKGKDLRMNCTLKEGIVDIASENLSLYSGSLVGSFKANLNSQGIPFHLDANIKQVKIEELKMDTQAKTQDISGLIDVQVNGNGLLNDFANLQGAGKLSISGGKLWELDLFKGLGKLLFSDNFANITFSEGNCDFIIKDKSIFTDNLILTGKMVNLSGPVKIGFDSSINAKLNVNIISELVPLTGTFKDVTTALMGQTGRFAEIKISGTLKEPKYKFGTAVADIIKGLAKTFFKQL